MQLQTQKETAKSYSGALTPEPGPIDPGAPCTRRAGSEPHLYRERLQFQSPHGGFLELSRELPSRHTHDSPLHLMEFES